jgi:hypothetical protein
VCLFAVLFFIRYSRHPLFTFLPNGYIDVVVMFLSVGWFGLGWDGMDVAEIYVCDIHTYKCAPRLLEFCYSLPPFHIPRTFFRWGKLNHPLGPIALMDVS